MQIIRFRYVPILLLGCGWTLILVGCSSGHSAREDDENPTLKVLRPATYDTVYAVDDVDQRPKPRGGMRAIVRRMDYPQAAKDARITGEVMVEFVVAPDGQATNIRVTKSVHPLLDNEARRVVRASPYTPGVLDGRAVPVRVFLPLSFHMRN